LIPLATVPHSLFRKFNEVLGQRLATLDVTEVKPMSAVPIVFCVKCILRIEGPYKEHANIKTACVVLPELVFNVL
jgi:hypothetical protein